MTKPVRSVDGSDMDPLIAAQAAMAFFQASRGVVESLPSDPARTEATVSMGDLIASATSLALSAELFLKALLILCGCPVPVSHDLLELWERLPDSEKQILRDAYEERRALQHGAAATIQLVFSPSGEDCGPVAPAETGPRDNSLEAVLARSRHDFCSWRYLHEITQSTGIAAVNYEFHHLGALVFAASDRCHGLIFGGNPGPRHH